MSTKILNPNSTWVQRWVRAPLLVAVFGVSAALHSYAELSFCDFMWSVPFDKSLWNCDIKFRPTMIGDLVQSGQLIGLSIEQAESLLGQTYNKISHPTETPRITHIFDADEEWFNYSIPTNSKHRDVQLEVDFESGRCVGGFASFVNYRLSFGKPFSR